MRSFSLYFFYSHAMKYLIYITLSVFLFSSVQAADTEDNSILDELNKQNTQELEYDFSLKTFDSCDAFEDVMEDYLKMYWENSYKNTGYYRGGPVPMLEMMETDSVMQSDAVSSKVANEGVG